MSDSQPTVGDLVIAGVEFEPLGPDIPESDLPGIYFALPGEVLQSELRRLVTEIVRRRRAPATPDATKPAMAALERASELFHEILSAINTKKLLAELPTSKGALDCGECQGRGMVVQSYGIEGVTEVSCPACSSATPAQRKMREALEGKLRDDKALAGLAADGFELCVRQLAAMGAPDITITSCHASDIHMPGSDGDDGAEE